LSSYLSTWSPLVKQNPHFTGSQFSKRIGALKPIYPKL
jgi:hypothetical protein